MNTGKSIAVLCCTLLSIMLTCCTGLNPDHHDEDAIHLLDSVSGTKNYPRLAFVADSLEKAGSICSTISYYWQGYAAYRQMQRVTAEFYWNSSVKSGEKSTSHDDLAYYAKSASYLVGSYVRYREYDKALKISESVLSRLDHLHFDATSDYNNLLIILGCSELHYGMHIENVSQMWDKAYHRHLENMKANPTATSFKDAIAGVVNISYCCMDEGYYEAATEWADHLAHIVLEYDNLYHGDSKYVDKQWARFTIFKATALEKLGRKREAAVTFCEYQCTNFAQTFEGQMDACEYLTAAGRWSEAAANYDNLHSYMTIHGMDYSLENLQTYMLKMYRANAEAGRLAVSDSVARTICEHLDSAIVISRLQDAEEQEIIRSKEAQIVEQQRSMERQMLIIAFIVLIALLVTATIYIFMRNQHARHLAEKNAQLKLANARAEESSRMKTNFIQQISHEIRTPLNILSGFTQIITTPGMELEEAERSEINKGIVENTDRITGLVNKMLEMADASSQTVIECNDEVTPEQIAFDAIGKIGIAQSEGITFDYQADENISSVLLHTSHSQSVRVLSLLLDNARKFLVRPMMPVQGTVRLFLRCGSVLPSDGTSQPSVSFVVEDTGIGIPAEEAEHIFEDFVQLDDYYDGTGIGLSVARSIARRMGGDVILDTSYTGGARFVFTL